MAINIYGSCSGSSGSKYDIWLNVKQNSQSVENNTSNVTVKLLLKRNDSYASSAYNLTESANTAELIVGGTTRVNKNLSIDTRNSATVTLATWTGNVSHADDGSLSLSLNGSFTMEGTSLSGGSVSGSFDCTDIPRASTLTLSKSSLNPEDTVGATLTAASSAFSHKIKWSLGDSSVTHSLSAGVTQDVFTVPLSWAEEITTAKSGKISVALTTYKGTTKIGSKTYTLKLVIPSTEEFLPQFTLSIERIDNSVPEEIGEYVKGKSQIKLNVENLTLMHGAKASSYTAKVDSSSKTAIPATFDLLKSGDITVSVTVKDSRGFSVTKSETITVFDYSAPTVSVKSLYRCDESGNKTTTGTYLLADLNSVYSSINGKNAPVIVYKYKKADSNTYSEEAVIAEAPCILGGDFLNNSSYTVAFKITDSITMENDFNENLVPSADIPFNIRNGGKGASFGCYAEKDNELTVAWDLNVKGNIVYEDAPVTISDKVNDLKGISRYIPCLECVMVRLRFTVNAELSAGEDHVLGTFYNHIPAVITPLCLSIGSGMRQAGSAIVKSGTGEVVVTSDEAIPSGTYIYVSGVYFAFRE